MYNFNLYQIQGNPPSTLFGELNKFDKLMTSNITDMISYQSRVHWYYKSQNILVSFLNDFRIDNKWEDEFIFNYIKANYNKIASKFNIVSIWNKGKNNKNNLFKEDNHNVLFVIPMGCEKRGLQYYLETPVDKLEALTTLYTTDETIRYDGSTLGTSAKYLNPLGDIYSVVQIDPFALVFGYLKYSKMCEANGRSVLPHTYIGTYPLINFYRQHNLMVMFNYLCGNYPNINIEDTEFNKLDLKDIIKKFILFQESILQKTRYKDISYFIHQFNQLPNFKHLLKSSLYPNGYDSKYYSQLKWVYDYGSIATMRKYIYYRRLLGIPDSVLNNELKIKFKLGVNNLILNIEDPLWKKHYKDIFNELEKETK